MGVLSWAILESTNWFATLFWQESGLAICVRGFAQYVRRIMNSPLRIGLVGCGRVAQQFYLPAIRDLSEARLMAVADSRPEQVRVFLSEFPACRFFSSAHELLDETELEALIVATPPETHAGIAELALRRAVSVLVEKPLATSMAGIPELQDAAACSSASLLVGFNRRFWTPVSLLREALRDNHSSGVAAELVMTTNSRAWIPISDPLDDLASHQLDLIQYLFESPVRVVSARWLNPCTVQLNLKLHGGIEATCFAAQTDVSTESITIRSEYHQYRVHISMGSERIKPAHGLVRSVLDFGGALNRRIQRRPSALRLSFKKQLQYFLDCVRTRSQPEPSLEAGIRVICAIEAARKSAARGGAEVYV